MADIARVRIGLTNWAGAPGVITEHYTLGGLTAWSDAAAGDLTNMVALRYEELADYFLTDMSIQVEPAVGIISETGGGLIDVFTASVVPAPILGVGTGLNLSRGTMMGIRLVTSEFQNGQRVQGKNFLGPIAENALDTNGEIAVVVRGLVQATYADSISGENGALCVYSRPIADPVKFGHAYDVATVVVPAMPFNLSSRRT